jgi:hypothetical protein
MQSRLMILIILFIVTTVKGQSQHQLTSKDFEDFATQARKQVLLFFDSVGDLGASKDPPNIKEKAISNVVKIFSVNGKVEERSKGATSGTVRPVREYLNAIASRGQKSPILVSYDFVDPLTYQEFTPVKNADGSTSYKGEMIVRQFYCKLKPKDQLTDKLESNCIYDDTTLKRITIEVRKLTSELGRSYAVLIANISVMSVK